MTEVDLSPLYGILEKMGASPFGGKLGTPEGIPVEEGNIIFRNGIIYMIDKETGTEYQSTIHIKNQKSLSENDIISQFKDNVLISKVKEKFRRKEESRKIHLAQCSTIDTMIEKNEFFKYHGNQRKDHIRRVLARNGECDVPLFVCKMCIEQFNIEKRYFQRVKIAGDFDFSKWLGKIKGTGGDMFAGVQPDTAAADDYPTNWVTIRRKYKDKVNWTCECCNVNLLEDKQWLDAHHINKKKNDCRDENLRALCKLCHAKQPHHEHMGGDKTVVPHLSELRQKQGLGRRCSNCGS